MTILHIIKKQGLGLCVKVPTIGVDGKPFEIEALASTGVAVCYMSERMYAKLSNEPVVKSKSPHESGAYYIGTIRDYGIGTISVFRVGNEVLKDITVIVTNFSESYGVECILGHYVICAGTGIIMDFSEGQVVLNPDRDAIGE
ncbi:hypothetical protein FACS1894188_11590 [Clostridia bacterium]|nr:hypothetical protein FACS1894188_11590 [Clostridia bacterium]